MDAGARQNSFYCSAHPNIAKSEHKWIQRTVSVLRKIEKKNQHDLYPQSLNHKGSKTRTQKLLSLAGATLRCLTDDRERRRRFR